MPYRDFHSWEKPDLQMIKITMFLPVLEIICQLAAETSFALWINEWMTWNLNKVYLLLARCLYNNTWLLWDTKFLMFDSTSHFFAALTLRYQVEHSENFHIWASPMYYSVYPLIGHDITNIVVMWLCSPKWGCSM